MLSYVFICTYSFVWLASTVLINVHLFHTTLRTLDSVADVPLHFWDSPICTLAPFACESAQIAELLVCIILHLYFYRFLNNPFSRWLVWNRMGERWLENEKEYKGMLMMESCLEQSSSPISDYPETQKEVPVTQIPLPDS